jgi:hypothetical protein
MPGMELCQKHALHVWAQVNADIEGGEIPAPERPKAKARPAKGVIYYLQNGDRIKVGYASNLAQRMRTYPPNAEILAVHPGTLADEQRIHAELSAHRAAGREWYHPSPILLEYIAAVVEEWGEPEIKTPIRVRPTATPMRKTPTSRRYRQGQIHM